MAHHSEEESVPSQLPNGHTPRRKRPRPDDDDAPSPPPSSLLKVSRSQSQPIDTPSAQAAIESLLRSLGEDPSRPGLRSTPRRVADMFSELLSGYRTDATKLINGALFEEAANDLVLIKNMKFYSMCEHHLLTFSGSVHVAYVPDGRVIGLSKVPRIVEMFARRLQLQERLTAQIAEFLNHVLKPSALAVVIDGSHLCATIRGVRSPHASVTTSIMLGDFKTDASLRTQFWSQLRSASH
eukprot:TRINITY_DN78703_c0_g1_i1.p1 TRINITY_DN78703_c0_g1~~TRINITY_DN78703_c0_g1_i1.p1  ORF type:complete len:253 (+),score=62.28 TRINITY_DN78703_c0_g1_i1:44-760(+)